MKDNILMPIFFVLGLREIKEFREFREGLRALRTHSGSLHPYIH